MKETRAITGRMCRLDHPAVKKARDSFNTGTPRFGATLIYAKDDSITGSNVKRAIQAAYDAGQEKLRGPDGKVPPLSDVKTPIHDGDKEKANFETYDNTYFINAYNSRQPEVVDKNKNKLDPSEVYAGMFARVILDFYAYRHGDSCGITCSLLAIQKTKDGERLGGRSVVDDFPDDDDDDDEDDDEDDDILR